MTTVYKVTLLVSNINGDCPTVDEVIQQLEGNRHPEFVRVMEIEQREIDYSDDHPLNKSATTHQAFFDLFSE